VRIGFKEAREGSRVFYTHIVGGGKNIHAADRYLKIIEYLGCDTAEIRFPFPPIERSLSFHAHDRYAVLVPGAKRKTKRWPVEKFGQLASLLPIKTVIVGSRSDTNIADEIISLSNGKAIFLARKTDIKDLIDVMCRAQFVVSNDSGPMHITGCTWESRFCDIWANRFYKDRPLMVKDIPLLNQILLVHCVSRNHVMI
jgi:heptosyltransferase I